MKLKIVDGKTIHYVDVSSIYEAQLVTNHLMRILPDAIITIEGDDVETA